MVRGYAYPRPVAVQASELSEAGVFKSKDGKTYQHKAGDFKVWDYAEKTPSGHKGNPESAWVVDRDIFLKSYTRKDDHYVKKAIKIPFEIADDDGTIDTLEGTMPYNSGDYIVTGIQGERYPMSAARFKQRYYRVHTEKASSESASMLNNLIVDASKAYPTHNIPEHAALINMGDFQAVRLMTLEKAANVTTAVGKLGIYLMYFAIYAYMKEKKLDPGKQIIADLKEAYGRLPMNDLAKLGIRKRSLVSTTDPSWLRNQLADFREANRSIREMVKIPEVERKLLTLAIRVGRADASASALRQLETIAYQISPDLGGKINQHVHGTDDNKKSKSATTDKLSGLHKSLSAVVKKMGGTGYTLTLDKAVKAREGKSTSSLYAEYNSIRREIRKVFEVEFRKLIAGNDNKPIDADAASKAMANKGFLLPLVPDSKIGFLGRVGIQNGKLALYTKTGKLISGNITPGSSVRMNKKYGVDSDDVYVMIVKAPGAVGSQRVYTAESKGRKQTSKFEKADNLEKILPKLLKAWARDLKSTDPMKRAQATAATILYWTGARVGSRTDGMQSRKGVEGFGILNLRLRHIKINSSAITLDYAGKKGMQQKHIIPLKTPDQKLVAKNLQNLIDGKTKEDLIFTVPGKTKGRTLTLTHGLFSRYLKSNGFTMGAHKLRHVRGNKIVRSILEVNEWKPSKSATTLAKKQREAESWMKEKVLVKVAQNLGHQSRSKTGEIKPAWMTSINSYINPAIIKDWFVKNSLDIPNWLKKVVND